VNPYPLLYRLGITPWERSSVPKPVLELADTAEQPGRALDLGCGTGRDAVYLGGRGWAVTGVDAVPQAIAGAHRRASEAATEVQWVLGDVTRLRTLGIADDYSLVIDRGCFHGLSERERERCAQEVTAVTAPGARFLMFAFEPRALGVGPRGVTREQIEAHFAPAWELESSARDPDSRPPWWVGKAKPTWHRLRRTG
jgi:SAM-dependent methyltransferase